MNPPFAIPKDLAGPHAGPLAAYVERYATLIQGQGYRSATLRLHLQLIANFNRWLVRTHHDLRDVDESVLRRFLRSRFGNQPPANGALHVLRRLIGLIRASGVAFADRPLPPSPADRMISNYRRYLLDELGLASSTVVGYEWHIRKFLLRQYGAGQINFRRLQIQDAVRCERRRERASILAV